MGTEIFWYRCSIYYRTIRVKLNNPLMGTETITYVFCHTLGNCRPVKLNNPLMGTETTLLYSLQLYSCVSV